MEDAHLLLVAAAPVGLPMKASIGKSPTTPQKFLAANSLKTKLTIGNQSSSTLQRRDYAYPGKMELTIKITQFPVDVKTGQRLETV